MNKKFCKLENGKLTYAPDFVRLDGLGVWNPTSEIYAACGWLPVVDERPAAREGYTAVPAGWTERGGEIVRVYEERAVEPSAPPVVRYSKLKLIVAAKAAGKWDAIKAFIAQAGYEDEWAACQFLASDYAQFADAKTAIAAAGVANADELDAILAASVDEEAR